MKRVQIVITLFIGGCNVTHIYLPSGPTCYAIAAHELGHVLGSRAWTDRL